VETSPKPDRTLGQTLVGIAHSPCSKPEFLLEGIGSARFRAHYLTLANGLVLDLFTAGLLVMCLRVDVRSGETFGIAPADLLGRRLVGVARDD
jgi:hypothetical protein